MERFIPILKADMSVLEGYEYRHDEPFRFNLSVFGGIEDKHVNTDDLEAWRSQSTGRFRIRQFPGGHFYFRDARLTLLESIGQDLIEILSRGSFRDH
jgi:surfactin synthase thioesterase subunit